MNNVKKFYDSYAEQISYQILSKLININENAYSIKSHAALKDIFKTPKKSVWANYHVDFLITDTDEYPILAIEIDGIEHLNIPDVRERDRIIMQLFFDNSVPLIHIPISQLPSYSKEDYVRYYKIALQKMIISFLLKFMNRTEYPAYCKSCHKQMQYKSRKDYQGFFYACENPNCPKCQKQPNEKFAHNNTISADEIPQLLSTTFLDYITFNND